MAHQITGELTRDRELDPMLDAIGAFIADNEAANGADLADFHRGNVVIIPPEATDKFIDEAIQSAAAKAKGLALLIVGGSAKNPDTDAPGPRATIDLELQLFIHPRLRPKGSRTAMELVAALMRGLHDAQIHLTGFAWYEEIRWTSFEPLPDPDFLAWSISFEREIQF